MKVAAPMIVSNLDSTINQLKEKKEYFQGLDPATANQKKAEMKEADNAPKEKAKVFFLLLILHNFKNL
jgi:predicted Fe-Mo cluster-binding NifX family protein